ncbi:hypothetical protein [Nocardioides ferulae]|uniref:hypothetical protein n=1 Tax=Nocardioides ferulae TaxID=2340821 RepID=UPI000F87ABEE|nr:hypothetical protein [Nocardioides ferulae]
MGKGKGKGGKAAKTAASKPGSKPGSKVAKLPKTKCCVSKDRCQRCPIRMLKEGTLPPGYTVKKRVLVRADGKKATKKSLQKVA